MNDRPNDLIRIRPEIKKTFHFDTMSPDESFQNITIRPILKLQNPLLIIVFHNYIQKRKDVFYGLNIEKKLNYIDNALVKDQKFRNSVKGMVIGHFTVEEYKYYCTNSSSINKRIMNMVIQRIKDQIQLFESHDTIF